MSKRASCAGICRDWQRGPQSDIENGRDAGASCNVMESFQQLFLSQGCDPLSERHREGSCYALAAGMQWHYCVSRRIRVSLERSSIARARHKLSAPRSEPISPCYPARRRVLSVAPFALLPAEPQRRSHLQHPTISIGHPYPYTRHPLLQHRHISSLAQGLPNRIPWRAVSVQ